MVQKLQIKEGHKVLIINPPQGYKEKSFRSLPKTAVVVKVLEAPADIIQVYVESKRELEEQLGRVKTLLGSKGIPWVTYPKGTSRTKVDINRDIIREYGFLKACPRGFK